MHRNGRQESWIAAAIIAAVFLVLLLVNMGPQRRGVHGETSQFSSEDSTEPSGVEQVAVSHSSALGNSGDKEAGTPSELFQPQAGAFPYRLSNTLQPLEVLARNEYALLLNNALLDSRIAMDFSIPEHLRAGAAPGAYIVQSDGPITPDFVRWLENQGADIVSYVPNNAYLARVSDEVAGRLNGDRRIASVVPYEPYFKVERALLPAAVNQRALPTDRWVRVVGFPGTEAVLESAFASENVDVVSSGPAPFGPSYVLSGAGDDVSFWARMPDVQFVELARDRVAANDLARQRTNVEVPILIPAEEEGEEDILSSTNYLGLTGVNIPVNVNDSGVDASHPDLAGRVFPGDPGDISTMVDPVGHGTHVAGTIASSGENSPLGDEEGGPAAYGSEIDADFRGMAPDATIYALPIDLDTGPTLSDSYLISTAAERNYDELNRTNPMVSNNSWGYLNANDYDSASASYDAAVRDALPEVSGAQGLVYVFAAGNEGEAFANGTGGLRGTIRSPGNAKNVITVGAIEAFRNITNEFYTTNQVVDPDTGEEVDQVITNVYFLDDTDSRTEVAAFSSRGNVSIGVEGPEGRFKPDVVAPGTFIASTRSAQWSTPLIEIDRQVEWIRDVTVAPGELMQRIWFVGSDATRVTIDIVPNDASSNPTELALPIYATYGELATLGDFIAVDSLALPEDLELQPLRTLNYAVGNLGSQPETFDIRVTVESEIESGGDRLEALAEINEPLAPYYRYESGTSMAAPVVSGALALIQQYLEDNEFEYSAALLKAMLINGARSVSNAYHPRTGGESNAQGWGLINLTNSLPAAPFGEDGETGSARFLNQGDDTAVTTGEGRSWRLTFTEEALESDLRLTLVWTDPPGNPAAGIKLVNDLDLVVTNTIPGTEVEGDDGETSIVGSETNVYIGNRFAVNEDYIRPLGDGEDRETDIVNNVENIFIRGPLNTNEYVITVRGARVNVNASPGHPNGIVQDYALVASLGDNSVTNGIMVEPIEPGPDFELALDYPEPISITNGVPLFDQRASANSPLRGEALNGVGLGTPEQWRFYVFTNSVPEIDPGVPGEQEPENQVTLTNGANVAFITFFPPNVSTPARNNDADLDLYVTRDDPGLLDLDPISLENAIRSTGPGGTEQIVFDDAALGEVFYIGVKSEDQRAGEYGFVGLSSDEPFGGVDEDGNPFINGLPLNVTVPDGDAINPGQQLIFAPGIRPELVNSVWVETTAISTDFGDVIGNLSHNGEFAVLFNNSLDFGLIDNAALPDVQSFIFDDSDSGRINSINLRPSDGPGSLQSFIGQPAQGPWIFAVVDNQPEGSTTISQFVIRYTPLQQLGDQFIAGEVLPNQFTYFVADSPQDAERMIVTLRDINPSVPLELYVLQDEAPTLDNFAKRATIPPPGGQLSHSTRDAPPFNPGRHFIGVFNPNSELVRFEIKVDFESNPESIDYESIALAPEEPLRLKDNAITTSAFTVDSDRRISDIRVGVRIDHPRVSDLDLRLVSPSRQTIVLNESRGLDVATSLGSSLGGTNHSFVTFTAVTNIDDLIDTAGRPVFQEDLDFIKFAAAPFALDDSLLVVSNALLKEEDFDEIDLGVYPVGHDFGNLLVKFEDMEIFEEGPDDDLNRYIFLEGGLEATFRTRVGREYLVSFGFRGAEELPAVVQVLTNGVRSGSAVYDIEDRIELGPDAYKVATQGLRARSTETAFEVRPLRPISESDLDFIRLEEVGVLPDIYYLPEEPLRLLVGERALGEWSLEVDDRRAGPELGEDDSDPILLDWKVEIRLANPDIEAQTLTNGVPYIGTIANDDIQYFRVEVPVVATAATNILSGAGDLVLSGNRDGVPFGDPDLDDYYVDNFGIDEGEFLLLTTNEPPAAPLQPGQTYYLGVQNFLPDQTNSFQVAVFFDRAGGFDSSSIPELLPGVTETNTIDGTDLDGLFDYWRVTVDDPEIDGVVSIDRETANVDLYARRFDDPTQTAVLPTFRTFDGLSTNVPPDLDDIRVTLYPSFIANNEIQLDVGEWFIGVINRDADPGEYEITYNETLADVVDLEDGVPLEGTLGSGFDEVLGFSVNYYRFDVPGDARRALFETFEATGDVALVLRQGAPVPSVGSLPINQHYFSADIGDTQTIIVDGLSDPEPLTPGDWYLAVFNFGGESVDYRIRVATDRIQSTILENEIPIDAMIGLGGRSDRPATDYYRFNVSGAAERVQFELGGMNGDENIDMLVVYGLENGPPSDSNFDYPAPVSNIDPSPSVNPVPGATEIIDIRPNSLPTPLQGGFWYVAVVYRGSDDTAPDTPYSLTVREFVPEIEDLAIGELKGGVIDAEGALDEYRIEVSPLAQSLRIDVENLAGDVDAYLRRGARATAKQFDTASETPAPEPEVLLMSNRSGSVRLTPGEWFISVVSRTTEPSEYSIIATEHTPGLTTVRRGETLRIPARFLDQVDRFVYELDLEDVVTMSARTETPLGGVRSGSPDLSLYLAEGITPNLDAANADGADDDTGTARRLVDLDASDSDPTVSFAPGLWTAAGIKSLGSMADFDYEITVDPVIRITDGYERSDLIEFERGVHFYRLDALGDGESTLTLSLDGLDGAADLLVGSEFEPARLGQFRDFTGDNPGMEDERVTLDAAALVDGTPWYVAVVSRQQDPVNYRLTVSAETPGITALENGVALEETIAAGATKYYLYDASSVATGVELKSFGADVDLTLFAKRDLPLPGPSGFDRRSQSRGLGDESVFFVGPNDDVVIGPQRFYVAIQNNDAVEGSFMIRALERRSLTGSDGVVITPDVVEDRGSICFSWDSIPGTQYRLEERLTPDDPWTTLQDRIFATEERTEVCLRSFRVDGEEFRVVALEEEVPDDPGGEPGRILVPGLTVAADELCLTWESVVGRRYRVEGRVDLSSPWDIFAGIVVAEDTVTEVCLPLDGLTATFFRIVELGDDPEPPTPGEPESFLDPMIAVTDTEVCLTWTALIGRVYRLEGRDDLNSDWGAIGSNIVADTEEETLCIPLDGLSATFFRVVLLSEGEEPPPTPGEPEAFIDPLISVADTEVCLTWTALVGRVYRLEGRDDLNSEWLAIGANVVADEEEETLCVPLDGLTATFFRIVLLAEGDGEEPPTTPGEPVGFLDASLSIDADEVCLTWISEIGTPYQLQGRDSLSDPWEPIGDPMIADADEETLCIPLDGLSATFFRIAVLGDGGVEPEPVEETPVSPGSVTLRDNEVCIQWDAADGQTFRVERTSSLVDPDWQPVDGTLTATGESAEFCAPVEDGTTGFFRVFRTSGSGGEEPPVEEVLTPIRAAGASLTDEGLCVQWDAEIGLVYRFERRAALGDAWQLIPDSEVTADQESMETCLPVDETNVGFYRILVVQ